MPLSMISPGETSLIKKINGRDGTQRHLADLGFVVGEMVTVIAEMSGSLILNVKGTRIALDKSMANRIIV